MNWLWKSPKYVSELCSLCVPQETNNILKQHLDLFLSKKYKFFQHSLTMSFQTCICPSSMEHKGGYFEECWEPNIHWDISQNILF